MPLSDAQAARLRDGQRAFYAREHWADNFEDSPWLPANKCSKSIGEVYGLQCYAAECAPPPVASFCCGNCTHNGRVA